MNRQVLDFETALKMLPQSETVHTFRSPFAGILIGADWERDEVIIAIQKYGAELSGPEAQAMKHGLVIHDGISHMFIETVEDKP